jgi:hypothetical protein
MGDVELTGGEADFEDLELGAAAQGAGDVLFDVL